MTPSALGDYHGGLTRWSAAAFSADAARTSYGHARTRYAAGDIALSNCWSHSAACMRLKP